jgi:DNA-binding transcriptional MerR regulator
MDQKADPELLLGSVAARVAGISEKRLRRWARDGLVPCRLDSAGRRIYNRESVEAAKRLRDRKGFRLPDGG